MSRRDTPRRTRPRRRLALVLGCTIALAGCFDVEQEIVLEADLSGSASVRMRIDMEPMVYFMAAMGRQMAGEPGEPTAEELQAARDRLLAQQEQEGDFDVEAFRGAQGDSLPEGIRLRDVQFSRQELQLSYAVEFEFDRLEDIVAIRLEDTGQANPNRGHPAERPFDTLRLEDDGETLLLTSKPINPAGGQQTGGQAPLEMDFAVADAMAGIRFAFTIDAPFEVMAHNATAVDGSTLIWEYDFESLTAAADQAPELIRVRYRK